MEYLPSSTKKVSIPCEGATITPLCFLTPPCTPLIPSMPLHPYSSVSVVPSLVSTHIYLFSITFTLRPDETATVWWLQKLVYNYTVIALFQQIRSYHIMDTNKVSNLFKYSKRCLNKKMNMLSLYMIWCS